MELPVLLIGPEVTFIPHRAGHALLKRRRVDWASITVGKVYIVDISAQTLLLESIFLGFAKSLVSAHHQNRETFVIVRVGLSQF